MLAVNLVRYCHLKVRGAPAIAIVGVLSLVAEIYNTPFSSVKEFGDHVQRCLDYLVSARPTAVNMADARRKIMKQFALWTQVAGITANALKSRSVELQL